MIERLEDALTEFCNAVERYLALQLVSGLLIVVGLLCMLMTMIGLRQPLKVTDWLWGVAIMGGLYVAWAIFMIEMRRRAMTTLMIIVVEETTEEIEEEQ